MLDEETNLDAKVVQQLAQALQPTVDEVSVEFEGLPSENPEAMAVDEVQVPRGTEVLGSLLNYTSPLVAMPKKAHGMAQAPFLVPPIITGSPFRVYCMLPPGVPAPTAALVKARIPEGQLASRVAARPADVLTKGSMIHTLAARALIRDLQDGTSFMHAQAWYPPQPSAVRAEIVRLGLLYNLVSKHTSFVATQSASGIFARESTRPAGQQQQQQQQQQQLQQQAQRQQKRYQPPQQPQYAPKATDIGLLLRSFGLGVGNEMLKSASGGDFFKGSLDAPVYKSAGSPIYKSAGGPGYKSAGGQGLCLVRSAIDLEQGAFGETPAKRACAVAISSGGRLLDQHAALVQVQAFDGSFPQVQAVAQLCGLGLEAAVQAAMPPEASGDLVLWLTALAVAVLTASAGTDSKARFPQYELVVAKARRWLERQASARSLNLSAVEQAARAALAHSS